MKRTVDDSTTQNLIIAMVILGFIVWSFWRMGL